MKGFELFEYRLRGRWVGWEEVKKNSVRGRKIEGVRGLNSIREPPVEKVDEIVGKAKLEEQIAKIKPLISRPNL